MSLSTEGSRAASLYSEWEWEQSTTEGACRQWGQYQNGKTKDKSDMFVWVIVPGCLRPLQGYRMLSQHNPQACLNSSPRCLKQEGFGRNQTDTFFFPRKCLGSVEKHWKLVCWEKWEPLSFLSFLKGKMMMLSKYWHVSQIAFCNEGRGWIHSSGWHLFTQNKSFMGSEIFLSTLQNNVTPNKSHYDPKYSDLERCPTPTGSFGSVGTLHF